MFYAMFACQTTEIYVICATSTYCRILEVNKDMPPGVHIMFDIESVQKMPRKWLKNVGKHQKSLVSPIHTNKGVPRKDEAKDTINNTLRYIPSFNVLQLMLPTQCFCSRSMYILTNNDESHKQIDQLYSREGSVGSVSSSHSNYSSQLRISI